MLDFIVWNVEQKLECAVMRTHELVDSYRCAFDQTSRIEVLRGGDKLA